MSDEDEKQVEELLVRLENGEVSPLEVVAQVEGPIALGKAEPEMPAFIAEEPKEEQEHLDIRTQIQGMRLPQKVKLALFGNSVCRGLLIFEPNRLIPMFVLRNPKIQTNEIEGFAKNSNMADYILRAISERKEWMKSYTLKVSLVLNPKTPPDVALKWLRYLNANEIKKVSRSKSIPQLIAVTAKKRLVELEKK